MRPGTGRPAEHINIYIEYIKRKREPEQTAADQRKNVARKIFLKNLKKGVDILAKVCYITITERNTGRKSRKEINRMTMSESARLILGLRAKGWSDTDITNLILWIETGEEQYRPQPDE